MKRFQRSWVQGTEEYKKRILYPGIVLQCDNLECINNKNMLPEQKLYWLCPDCTKRVPDTIIYNVHAPTKNILPMKKRKSQSVLAFIACIQNKIIAKKDVKPKKTI